MKDSPNPDENGNGNNQQKERGVLGSLYDSGKEMLPSLGLGLATAGLYHKVVEPAGSYTIGKIGALFTRQSVEETTGAQAKSMLGGSGYNPYA